MKRMWLVVALLGCSGEQADRPVDQAGSPAPGPGTPAVVDQAYKSDLEKLCDVVARSGGAEVQGHDRMYLVATWLGSNLETQDARKFLARIQPLAGEAKGLALEAEAKRVGLAGCELANEWRTPRSP